MTGELEGRALVLKNLNRLTTTMRSSVEKAVDGVVEEVLAESKKECPWKTGDLRRRGHPEVVRDDLNNYLFTIIYPLPYALKVHEDLSANHPRGGKAKYLEDPVNRAAPTLLRRIEFAMKKDLK